MRKLLILTCLLGLFFGAPLSTSLYAQNISSAGSNENVRDLAANDNTMTIMTFDTRYEGVKGHPYLMDNWVEGQLNTSDGKAYKNVELKYDLNRDELVLRKKATSEVVVLFNEQVKGFSLLGREFVMIKNDEGSHFYELLTTGDSPLLARRKKKLLKADYEGAYSAGRTQDEFLDAASAYYIQKDQILHPLKLNAKSIATALDVSAKEVKQKVKAQKLFLKEEKDLITLLRDF